MIDLKTACQNILSRYSDKYIHVVNEFKNVYAFILINNGEEVTENTCLIGFTVVDKHTGEITDNLLGFEDVFEGEYKQYFRNDLERLL